MASTRLTDIISVSDFTSVVEATLTENSKFRQSGIIGTDPRITAKAQTAGLETTLREWNRPVGGSATNGSDDPSSKAVAKKLGQSAMVARVTQRSEQFSAMDVADYASDSDAIAFATGEFARLRVADEEASLLAIASGLIANNVANNGGDMYSDLAVVTGSQVLFDTDVLIEGRKTMGDMGGSLGAIALHSDVVNNLRKAEPNAFIPASKTDIGLAMYNGYYIIETDNMDVDTGTADYPIYTGYMFGAGAFAYAACPIANGLVQFRDELAGDGSGEETILNRFRYLLHPAGHSNVAAPTNGVSQSLAEQAAAATWTRVAARKAIPLVGFTTNG